MSNVSVDDQSKKRQNREAVAFVVNLHSVWACKLLLFVLRVIESLFLRQFFRLRSVILEI